MNDGNLDAVLSQELSVDELKHVRVLVRGEELARSLEVQIAAGRAAGVRLTPTMVIHHAGKKTPIVGAVSHGILTRYLDKLLEKGR
jgi:predicted DsbA family dithiol-disulfide isomerase